MDKKIELFCIICDNCNHCEIYEFVDNETIKRKLNDGGWVIKKISNKWHDFCNDKCREEYNKNCFINK